MQKTLLATLLTLSLSLGAEPDRLILHFDVNGTITAGDTASRKNPEETVIQKLAEGVYGCWDKRIKAPLSYAEYIRRYRPETEINQLLPAMRKLNHPQLNEVQVEYERLMDKISGGQVFPSFYRLLDDLDRDGIPYTVHLRTFGGDLEAVARDASEKRGSPLFPKRLWCQRGMFVDASGAVLSIREAYLAFCEGNIAGQEDWAHWLAGKKRADHSKPFPIDTTDVGTLSIFFDDHIEAGDSPTNIVAPTDLAGKPLDVDGLIASGQLCQVDTLEAIRDPDYFIKKVKDARDRTRTYTPCGTRT